MNLVVLISTFSSVTLFLLVEATQCQGLISLNRVVFSFKIYFSFSFYSNFNLEAAVVKTDEIKGFKQLFTPCIFLIGKKNLSKIINNNYRIAHQKK